MLIGPMVHTKTNIFNHFYQQYLVLLTRVPRKSVLKNMPGTRYARRKKTFRSAEKLHYTSKPVLHVGYDETLLRARVVWECNLV